MNVRSLRAASHKIKKFCTATVYRWVISGNVVKSNITDSDSASMLTSHDALQGLNGVTAVDDKPRVVIAADAFGQTPENNLGEVTFIRQMKFFIWLMPAT
jgi:hypothetical protein